MDYRNTFRRVHPFTRMLLLGLMMFVGLIVVLGIGLIIAIPILGQDALTLLGGGDVDPGNIPILRYFQILSHVGLFIVPSIVFVVVVSPRPAGFLQANRRPGLSPFIIGSLIMFAALPMVGFLTQINQSLHLPEALQSIENWMRNTEAAAEEITKRFLQMHSWQDFAVNLLMIAIIPAIGEEFIFRGIIQKQFTEWTRNRHVAVFITAILFSAMHLQFFSFLPRVWLGIILGYMLVYSGNIWLPVLAHFVNNAAALIFYHYYETGQLDIEIDDIGAGPMGTLMAVTSLVVIIALFVAFRRAVSRR